MTKHPDRSCLGMLPGVAADTTQAPDQTPTNRLQSRTLIKRHPMAAFLGNGVRDLWAIWMPVLFLGAPPRLFSAVGALLGLALPGFLITAITEGRSGVRDLAYRAVRWRVGVAWYLLAGLAIPLAALLIAPIFLGSAPPPGVRQELVATGHHLRAAAGARTGDRTVLRGTRVGRLRATSAAGTPWRTEGLGLRRAGIRLVAPTDLRRAPISAQSLMHDLSVLAIVLPFAIVFRILIAYAYNRTAYAILIAAMTYASFNEASELISPNVEGPLAQILAFASTALLAVLAGVVNKGTLAYHRKLGTHEAHVDSGWTVTGNRIGRD